MLTSDSEEVAETTRAKRRRWPAAQKKRLVRESFEEGNAVSLVARRYGVHPNQLSRWRKLYQDGTLFHLRGDAEAVPAVELVAALSQIRHLHRVLGRKTAENERLRREVDKANLRLHMKRLRSHSDSGK